MEDKFVLFNEVSFGYEKQVILEKVSLELKKGTSYAIVGKSGSGKSTLLNLVAGFIKPTEGEINRSKKKHWFFISRTWIIPMANGS